MALNSKHKVMFLCTGNSCRSQMAEGLAQEMGKGFVDAYSAGLIPAGINPNAIKVMQEIGIDITRQKSEVIDPDLLGQMDMVITLCGHADSHCPALPPEIRKIHLPVDDPVGATGTEDEVLHEFRRARDEIRSIVQSIINDLSSCSPC